MWCIYSTYFILLLSVLSLWLPVKTKIQPWQCLLGITLALSIVSHVATLTAVFSIVLFYALIAIGHKYHTAWKVMIGVIAFALGVALEQHRIPGFHNLLVLDKIQITNNAIPFTLYLNLDKTLVGLIIIGLTLDLARRGIEWKILLKQLFLRLPIIIVIILGLSLIFTYVRFEPKLPQSLWIWGISNLFFTCLAEEALFRGFFQKALSHLEYKYAEYVAILIPALFFGLMHYPGGIHYVILTVTAGILYGWIYSVTKRIEASILAHFFLNLAHVLFFTYPALMR